MVKFQFIFFIFIESVRCGFFDLTDIEDPLALFWQKGFSFPQNNAACRVSVGSGGPVRLGNCLPKSLCLLSGGESHSNNNNCGNFLSCCIRSSDSRRTKSKISYFTSDAFSFGLDTGYIVEVQKNVCQVRLDFEQFQLSPSTTSMTGSTQRIQICGGDYMTVTPNTYKIPVFCEYNEGQHVYVHLDSETEVHLNMHIANRGSDTALPTPIWRIRITQLECPERRNFLAKHNIFEAETDFPLLAPEGVIQYFTEPTGRIRSFGFNGQTGDYISDLYYAIAFKRNPYVNCVRFNVNYIRLRNNLQANVHSRICYDYLFIPELQGGDDLFRSDQMSNVCNYNNDITNPFYSNSPGPFYIYFRSNPYIDAKSGPFGFDIQYELTTCSNTIIIPP